MNSSLSLPVSTIYPLPVLINVDGGQPPVSVLPRSRPEPLQRPLRALTGCSTKLSGYPSRPAGFWLAVERYFAACALEHPLWPTERQAGFDPAVWMQNEMQPGCLGVDGFTSLAAAPAITDAEVEQCGYLGWLCR